MGIDSAAIMLLFGAKAAGADFSSTLTLGRQEFFPSVRPLASAFHAHGIDLDVKTFITESGSASDRFLALLGARRIDSLDASDYDDASIIHDLNEPVPPSLCDRFSAVYDGGTLEHVFNFPQAVESCMKMVKVGGYFLSTSMANNFMGHGFYQFSPELMFRLFSQEAGFDRPVVLLHEARKNGTWYRALDPASLRRRAEVNNGPPLLICTCARKNADMHQERRWPQQSDYSDQWTAGEAQQGETVTSATAAGGIRHTVKRCLPHSIVDRLQRYLAARSRRWGRSPAFRALSYDQVVRARW
jgi:hypothetical protein